jgi:dTDP-4-dehydrorhamnose reductase
MNALIGHTGLIGSVLAQGIDIDLTYNSANINQIQHRQFDTVYCAAPSGNRLRANREPDWDTENVQRLADNLRTVGANRFVLIGSVDAVYAPNSVYGSNRLSLEHFAQTQFEHCYVIRLCTLIHPRISKNLLFDMRHRQYLDRVNGAVVRQYYPLSRLCTDIATVIEHDIREINLVSEPVSDSEMMQRFSPETVLTTTPVPPYDLHSQAPFGQYVLLKSEVFEHVTEYMND